MTTHAHEHPTGKGVRAIYVKLSLQEIATMIVIIDCVPRLVDRFEDVRNLRGKLMEAGATAEAANAGDQQIT